jgi:hypothetical protein
MSIAVKVNKYEPDYDLSFVPSTMFVAYVGY